MHENQRREGEREAENRPRRSSCERGLLVGQASVPLTREWSPGGSLTWGSVLPTFSVSELKAWDSSVGQWGDS